MRETIKLPVPTSRKEIRSLLERVAILRDTYKKNCEMPSAKLNPLDLAHYIYWKDFAYELDVKLTKMEIEGTY